MKHLKNLLLIMSFSLCAQNQSFDDLWYQMQNIYRSLEESCRAEELRNQYCHHYWDKTRQIIKNLILGKPNEYFLYNSDLSNAMVRTGFGQPQAYEVCYLKNCIKNSTRYLLSRIQETNRVHLGNECTELQCSTNTLGHLFYIAKICNVLTQLPSVIIEIGGGYGNLARLFKQAIPETTFFIVDLPEMIALQWLFLNLTMPNVIIEVHTTLPERFNAESIHLIPATLLSQLTLKADVFVSNFALSECPEYVQKLVVEKKFFNAETAYITGQLNGWGEQLAFLNHEFIIKSMERNFKKTLCQPFHIFSDSHKSYEIIGFNS